MPRLDDRLARAKVYLAIAESKDSKREAYKKAANEVVAYKKEYPKATWREIAISLGRTGQYVGQLAKWHGTGFKAETPFLMDGQATQRAARSHTKSVLTDPDETQKVLSDLSDEQVEQVVDAATEEQVKRTVYGGRQKPSVEDARRQEKAKQTARQKANPHQAVDAFIASLGPGRAKIRSICQGYQDLYAIVEDEEWRDYARDRLVAFQTDVNLAISEVLQGSIDDALARLLEGEEVK
jgi:hypothetical protein